MFTAAAYHFGSYCQAVEEAGFDYARIQQLVPRRWTRKTVIAELQKLHRQRQPLHHASIERHHADLMQAAYRKFGNYRRALSAAGFDYRLIRVRPMPSWTRGRVLAELRRLHAEGCPLWKRAVRRKSHYLVRAACRCFGSYEEAAAAAGIEPAALKPPPYRQWSPRKVVQELQQLRQDDISRLKPARLQREWPRLLRACRRRFGSYRSALQEAGIRYADVARQMHRPLSAEQVLARLHAIDERGDDMRYSQMSRTEPRLLDACRGRFGSYRHAMEAAKLQYPPQRPLRHWRRPLVLKTLRELDRKNVDLRYSKIRRSHLPLFVASTYYFGTYLAAVKEAGIDYRSIVHRHLKRHRPSTPRVTAAQKRNHAAPDLSMTKPPGLSVWSTDLKDAITARRGRRFGNATGTLAVRKPRKA